MSGASLHEGLVQFTLGLPGQVVLKSSLLYLTLHSNEWGIMPRCDGQVAGFRSPSDVFCHNTRADTVDNFSPWAIRLVVFLIVL